MIRKVRNVKIGQTITSTDFGGEKVVFLTVILRRWDWRDRRSRYAGSRIKAVPVLWKYKNEN